MTAGESEVRAGCGGCVELPARLEPWQVETCRRPERVRAWLDAHGSPVNILDPAPMARHADELRAGAARCGVDLGIYFARKANKALAFVTEARRLGLGVDVASERELAQVLELGVPGEHVVMTAAVKPEALLRLCVASQVTVVLDNADELARLVRLAAEGDSVVGVALRLAPDLGPGRHPTRFGFTAAEAIAAVPPGEASRLRVDGVHFHLDGYAAGDRVTAIAQALEVVDALRAGGHAPSFLDMGGGIPMSYLESEHQWEAFWTEHREALLGRRDALTFEGHAIARAGVYPAHQRPVRGAWLTAVLSAAAGEHTVADALGGRGLQLRCEPGRSLLDGCGLTAARVAHRKRRRDGVWLIGLEMNRTQCRSAAEDFLVDPLLLRPAEPDVDPGGATGPIEGYLVGAYCIERELLTWRRLRFPRGVEVGDIVVFPNTAGYLMHILESSSHQIPLARNLVLDASQPPRIDAIDVPRV